MTTKQNQEVLIIVASSPKAAADFFNEGDHKLPYEAYQYLNSRSVMYTVETLKIALLACAKEYRDWAFVSERIKSDGHNVVYGAKNLN